MNMNMKYKEDDERMNLTVNYKKLMRDWMTYGSLNMTQIMKEVEKIEKMNSDK